LAATLPLLAIAVGTIVCAWTQAAAAESKSAVTKASYSTGQEGGKLQWLPYRPGKTYSGRTVRQAAPENPTRTHQQDDPFANHGGKIGSIAQIGRLQDKGNGLLREPIAEPLFTYPLVEPLVTDPPTEPSTLPPLGDLESTPPAGIPFERPDYKTEAQLKNDPSAAPVPSLQQEWERNRPFLDTKCPSADDLKSIDQLTTDISIDPGELPKECPIDDEVFQTRAWAPTTFMWKASGLCHKPLYFEDVNLERYGHSHGPLLQPIISGGRFFLTIPALPYLMGLNPPPECLYTLGYYRPGDCAPYMLDPIPLSVRAALYQAGAVTGLV
jgi:hypothetical protein